MKFTPKQLRDWEHYEKVRASGAFNMLDPRAREATGLLRHEYLFVMENYSELKEQTENEAK